MGLRSRLRGHLSKMLSQDRECPTTTPAPSPVSAPVRAEEPAPPPVPKTTPPPPKPAAAAAPAATKPGAISDEKIAKHLAKTRKGVLSWLNKQGGSSPMADMHDYSERRYFVAHRKFSDLMEGFLEDELITFERSTGITALTDTGRQFVPD